MLNVITKLSTTKAICLCSSCDNEYTCNFYDARKSPVGHLCKPCKSIILNMSETDLTQEKLCKVFTYDEVSGELRYAIDTFQKRKEDLATYPHNQGYLSVSIGKKQYLAHRIIWIMQTGVEPKQIDHIDHNRSNNSWTNLREITSRQNQLNMGKSSSNTSGYTGVRIIPSGNYAAYIMVNRKQVSLGTYPTIEEAAEARAKANKHYGFHGNHGK